MTLRALIIDDEPLGRERLRRLLSAEPDIEVTGECKDGPSAVAAVGRVKPDVLFLDIQMPGMDGFEVLRALGTRRLPAVVFVTAYDEYALRAFDARALDYLLKPASRARLRQALERVRAQLSSSHTDSALRDLLKAMPVRRIAVRNGDQVFYVPVDDVHWIEASGNYVILHAAGTDHLIREAIGALEKQLAPDVFLRVSRSAIVNLCRVRELRPVPPDRHVAVLHDGQRVEITRGVREIERRLRFVDYWPGHHASGEERGKGPCLPGDVRR